MSAGGRVMRYKMCCCRAQVFELTNYVTKYLINQ